ncbi:MAG: substrate-binding domain-containing protein [Kiritimatiellae bacterium]|nr:substrate-binding domain-containing protein [Kiritimatiellia bacterium]
MIKSAKTILVACDWYDRRIYRGIARYASEHDWHLSPYLFSDRFVPRGWPADGAITSYGNVLGKFILSLDMPKVDISVCDIAETIPRVTVNNEAISRLAAEHFLARGFRHFAFYSWSIVDVNQIRMSSFFEALKEAGVPASSLHILKQPPARIMSDWDAHMEAIVGQLHDLPRPLAVFAGQDNLGATLVEVCARSGIHVPEEVAVLGVDNIEFLCDCLMVPLSSIDTRLDDLGYEAAHQLDRLMNKKIKKTAKPILIDPKEVVCRQSTDVLAVEHPAVVKALRFTKENFHNPITLDDIAAYAGMSKRGMEKAFVKCLGRTPAVELRRIRLDSAKRMLTETNEKVETIARECGYSNSSNLSFAFNKETSMSPRAYRKHFRASRGE